MGAVSKLAINLNKNKASLLKAWQDVFDDKSDTNWAVFGYAGKTYELKVAETGDGDIEELQDELNDGKMQYAVIKVLDPNTNLPKIVWINWQGEGVPSSVKGVCANHVKDVERFFKGAHVTINARSQDDVQEDVVIDKVKKSSGANYSFHKEKAKPMPAAGPVGSVYKRVEIQREIDVQKRDQFWTKTEEDERKRVAHEKQQRIQEHNELER